MLECLQRNTSIVGASTVIEIDVYWMAASPNQRGLCSRPPIFIGAMLAMLFVCAVLLKISKERGRQVAELDGLLMESQRTLETTSRDRDLAQLARKETETELEKIRNSKNGDMMIITDCTTIV